jgi:selenocysteine lyase/cysteine desulfurase
MPLYLDNAATSFPKPPEVFRAVADYGTNNGSTPGRGAYASSQAGGAIIRACRHKVLTLLGLPPTHSEQVIFGLNCSDVNNLAIHGLINHAARRGRPVHVVTTDLDHNSVLRPIRSREVDHIVWTCVASDSATGRVTEAAMHEAIDAAAGGVGPKGLVLVVMTHASNVLGSIQPVEAVGATCRRVQTSLGSQVVFMLDAAQTAGHVPMHLNQWNVDIWTAPGHKGLLGPMGTGVLWIRPGIEQIMDPLRQGGTGSRSELDTQPHAMPDKFEPGSHNAPGIAGLDAALAWIQRSGAECIARREHAIVETFLSGLGSLQAAGYTLLGPVTSENRIAIFTLTHADLDAHTLATLLETEHGILARAGLHCAPRAHAACGTTQGGGLRLSFSALNTPVDAKLACDALLQIASNARPRVILVPRETRITS